MSTELRHALAVFINNYGWMIMVAIILWVVSDD